MKETIENLERQVGDLLNLSEQMNRENEALRGDRHLLEEQFKILQDKNRIAKKRIEQILTRLKSMHS